jgi:hypothetical protein
MGAGIQIQLDPAPQAEGSIVILSAAKDPAGEQASEQDPSLRSG